MGNSAWPNLNYTVWPAANDTVISSYTNEFSLGNYHLSTHRFTRTDNQIVFESLFGLQRYNGTTNRFEKNIFYAVGFYQFFRSAGTNEFVVVSRATAF